MRLRTLFPRPEIGAQPLPRSTAFIEDLFAIILRLNVYVIITINMTKARIKRIWHFVFKAFGRL